MAYYDYSTFSTRGHQHLDQTVTAVKRDVQAVLHFVAAFKMHLQSIDEPDTEPELSQVASIYYHTVYRSLETAHDQSKVPRASSLVVTGEFIEQCLKVLSASSSSPACISPDPDVKIEKTPEIIKISDDESPSRPRKEAPQLRKPKQTVQLTTHQTAQELAASESDS
jgi:hypothetical protein